jgi:coenzyme F420-reducing hydrogenase alpha subunit
MHYSEQLQSHVLHVGYLVAPDLFGVPSVVPLVGIAPGPVKTIIGLHRLANEWSALLAGRITHPVTLRPGGLTKIPTATQLRELQDRLKKCLPDLKAVADVVLSRRRLRFERRAGAWARTPRGPLRYGEIASTNARAPWRSMTGRQWQQYVSDQ